MRVRRPVIVLAALTAAGSAVIAQGYRGAADDYGVPYCYSPEECPRAPYDGRFTFVRMYYDIGGGMFGRRGGGREPAWHHDRPEAERNLSSILREISYTRTFDGATGGNVIALDDPELFRYPVLWMSHVGDWQPSEKQVAMLRAYLLKGGFMIFDDFNQDEWGNFAYQMKRVLPEHEPMVLDATDGIFHSFFDVDPANLQLSGSGGGFGGGSAPVYLGMFEDNDRRKRQMVMINYRNDIGEFMEYSATGFVPVDLSNDAYKLGVNYIMYTLTH